MKYRAVNKLIELGPKNPFFYYCFLIFMLDLQYIITLIYGKFISIEPWVLCVLTIVQCAAAKLLVQLHDNFWKCSYNEPK